MPCATAHTVADITSVAIVACQVPGDGTPTIMEGGRSATDQAPLRPAEPVLHDKIPADEPLHAERYVARVEARAGRQAVGRQETALIGDLQDAGVAGAEQHDIAGCRWRIEE